MARVEQLAGTLPSIVSEMRSLISSRQTAEEARANWGWRHGGPRFADEMTKLKMELKAQGKPVSEFSFRGSIELRFLVLVPVFGRVLSFILSDADILVY
jgi:hypothetical protein